MESRDMFIGAGCLGLNLSLAKIAAMLSLPFYLDSVGTILASALLPWPLALGVAGLTSGVGAILINPYWGAYGGTQLAIAITAILCLRYGLLDSIYRAIGAGVIVALVAVLVSAPVTVLLFGGITLSSTTGVNALLLASGKSIWQSVIGGSLLIESLDKPAAAIMAYLVLRRLPTFVKSN